MSSVEVYCGTVGRARRSLLYSPDGVSVEFTVSGSLNKSEMISEQEQQQMIYDLEDAYYDIMDSIDAGTFVIEVVYLLNIVI